MKSSFPRPSDILEELAEKTISAIDSLAITRFESAFGEMVEYHRFLVDAYATRRSDGGPFNYAEIEAALFSRPHQEWIRQYSRVFERAIERIAQDTTFAETLSYVIGRLLPEDARTTSPKIISAILDLGPIFVARLENWFTRRVTLENAPGDSASPRISLSGSDQTAFAEVILQFVGAWESVLLLARGRYFPRNTKGELQWTDFASVWPFYWQHLSNTAYFVTAAVWNDDKIGAARFADALVRWPQVFEFEFPNRHYSRYGFLLFPDLLSLDWESARARVATIEANTSIDGYYNPSSLCAALVRHGHSDVILLTVGVMLRWQIDQKQASDIAPRTAAQLLQRKMADPEDPDVRSDGDDPLRFRSLFFSVLRLEIAGEKFDEQGYGGYLDSLVSSLDRMSERRVVPGRVFTPSTVSSRYDLLGPLVSLLIAYLPSDGDDGAVSRLEEAITVEARFSENDRSLYKLLQFLDRMSSLLKSTTDGIRRVVAGISPDADFEASARRLDGVVNEATEIIKRIRSARIRERRIDGSALERIRKASENAILTSPAGISIFEDIEISIALRSSEGGFATTKVTGLPKGVFTDPPMAWGWVSLDESIADSIKQWTANLVWQDFWRRPRNLVSVEHDLKEGSFWKALAVYAHEIGPSAVLLLPQPDINRLLREWVHLPGKRPSGLLVEDRPAGERRAGRYVASVEGIDIYRGGLPSGGPVLFSAADLKSVSYEAFAQSGNVIDLHFEPEDDPWKFTLTVQIVQRVEWRNFVIFEVAS